MAVERVPASIRRALAPTVRRFKPNPLVVAMNKLGEQLSREATAPEPWDGPEHLRGIADSYEVRDLLLEEGRVPLVWWPATPNYGDLLSPWLFGRMTGKPVVYSARQSPHYVAIGSIARYVRDQAIVWGTGSFGTEDNREFNTKASYRAVRGPLTRSRLLNVGVDCPRVYGDPALLLPLYSHAAVEKTHEVGIVARHSESTWNSLTPGDGVRIIGLGSSDVDRVTKEIRSCERIVSSSLHGLIVADAYGIPNAWLESDSAAGGSRPGGGEFKFYDYFASVQKMRHAQTPELSGTTIEARALIDQLEFDERPIDFDYAALLDACPFLARKG